MVRRGRGQYFTPYWVIDTLRLLKTHGDNLLTLYSQIDLVR